MKTLSLILLAAFCASGLFAMPSEPIKVLHIQFDTDDAYLDSADRADLDTLIAQVDRKKLFWFELEGTADDRGDSIYNQELSERRTQAVYDYFIDRGVAVSQLKPHSFGEQPEPTYNVDHQRQRDRSVRVELRQEEVFENTSLKPQTFKVNPSKREVLHTRGGVMVVIEPNTFVHESGRRLFGSVEVAVTEYLDMNDFIRGGLHSMSDSGLLQSGGMFNITASYGSDRSPVIAEGKALEVIIPTDTALPDMQVFYQDKGMDGFSHESALSPDTTSSQGDFGNFGASAWNLSEWDEYGSVWRDVTSERMVVNFKTARNKLTSTPFMTDEELKVFAEPGNEEELAFLLGRLVAERNETALQRALSVFPIAELYVADADQVNDTVRDLGRFYAVYKKSTMRVVRFTDSSFDPLQFNDLTGLMMRLRGENMIFDLTNYQLVETDLDSLTEGNVVKQRYRMRVNRLGMVNCDRFLRPDFAGRSLVQPFVQVEDSVSDGWNVALAFSDINALMPGTYSLGDRIIFGQVPKGMNATLIAYKTMGDEVLADVREIRINEGAISLDGSAMSKKEFNDRIGSL